MADILQEFCNSQGVSMSVDQQAGVICGVKLLGLESRNGRTYLPEALSQAIPLYENAKVNVNHPKGNPAAPRDYQDRIGTIRGVTFRPGAGLFGDFYFNPKHALAEQLVWDAVHAPENVGFSHNVEARLGRRGDRVVVEAISRVQSVDLVADPATTRGLFESDGHVDTHCEPAPPLTLEELKGRYPALVDSLREEQAATVQLLEEEVASLRATDRRHRRRETVRRLLREFDLPDPDLGEPWAETIIEPRFMEALISAPDEQTMHNMVAERARMLRTIAGGDWQRLLAHARPLSRDQYCGLNNPSASKSFVEAIT